MLLAVTILIYIAGTAAGQQEPCLDCHPDKQEGKVVHAAISMGCASCHSGTHSGEKPAPKLISAVPDLCFSCHDSAMVSGTVPHPPAKDGQCTFCHSPHSSDQPALLSQPAPALCGSCHDKQATGRHVMSRFGPNDSHPISGKPDPSRIGKTLSCASCHQPHGGNLKRLFPAASANGLPCMTCHTKISAAP
ncbi:MAG: cytochrome c3 family protein [Nitrospirota bacterium]|nr:cytochrome c3 family protein [Nitrospirota bacterium]